jgi:uncharacterized protein with GYD domain
MMPIYIVLGNYTQQGVQNFKDSPARLDSVKQAVQDAGGDVHAFYLTMGKYDMMMIAEFPNDETLLKLIITAAGEGNVSTETFRAFSEDEYRNIVADLP